MWIFLIILAILAYMKLLSPTVALIASGLLILWPRIQGLLPSTLSLTSNHSNCSCGG